jgi:hypothetical protein
MQIDDEDDTDRITLTKLERLVLINQFRILEKLYPQEAPDLSVHRLALEGGFELQYSVMFESFGTGLDSKQCKFVLDVLDMYRAMRRAHANLSVDERASITESDLRFEGFDGNNEPGYWAYTRYFICDLGRFDEFRPVTDSFGSFNSHQQMLHIYTRMLAAWRKCSDRFQLSANDIRNILASRYAGS